jgi:transglutaminase-like putative cysteine protease
MNVERRFLAAAILVVPAFLAPPGAPPARAADITTGEDAVILEEIRTIEVISPERGRVRHSSRIKILTPRGAERYGGVGISYNRWETITGLRASVLSPEGKKIEVKKHHIVDSNQFGSFELYSDSKQRTIVFPGAVPGAVVEYGYEKDVRNLFFLSSEISMQDEIPIQSRILTVTAPASFPLRISVRGGAPEYSRTEAGGRVTHRWQVRDAPGFKPEPDMPPFEDMVGRVSVTPKEVVWEGSRIDAGNWDGIAAWDWSLARDRMAPTPEVSQAARELTVGVHEPMEKIRRLYEFVQSKVDYVAIYLGLGGWQPHPAADILRHRYGDCKDKATLLIAMMRSLGIPGHHVLVNTRDEGIIDRDDPTPFVFNHVIVATPTEEGYLFMDPTSEKAPFGDLPYNDQGIPVVVVKDDGRADLVETPLTAPERNRTHRFVTAAIGPTGDLTGNYVADYWGQARLMMANVLESKPTDQEDYIEGLMSWLVPGAVLKGHEVTLPKGPTDPLRIAARFEIPRFVTRAGGFEVVSPHLVRLPGLTGIGAYSGRRTPVFFDYLFSVTTESRIRLPVGRVVKKLPADRSSSGPGMKAGTRHSLERDGDYQVMVVKRAVDVSRREIPVAEYPPLREFLSGLAQEESKAITIEAGSPAAGTPGATP